LKAWVEKARQLGASDLHLETGMPPVVRVRGELSALGDALPAAQLAEMAQALGREASDLLSTRGSADLSLTVAGARCRVNVYRTLRGISIALRLLAAASISGLHGTNLHPGLRRLVEARTGLVLVSGPTGSGKSTTLAALIEEVNGSAARHIITLESPLEYLFSHRRSFIRQREIPVHSPSYEQAITDALRENPDILVIGEMRTPEVMRLTLNAAETGHLVLATLHSATCAEALSRLCMSFPAEAQGSIRAQLADCLVGVVCQRLDYLEPHRLLVPRCEVLTASTAAKGTIRGGHLSQLATVIQAGGEDGMWSFERYQRWMEQKTDWVPAPVPLPAEVDMPHASEPVSLPLTRPGGVVAAPVAPPPQAPVARPAALRPAEPAEGSIEISIDIDEETDLAELARQVERRSS
jgi:twitching motility protein PilT